MDTAVSNWRTSHSDAYTMVCLSPDLILRYANSKGTKLRSEDSTEVFLKKLTHLNLTEKGIDEIVSILTS